MWEDFINEVEQTGLSFDEFLALYKLYSYENNTRKIYYESDMLNTYLELESRGFVKAYQSETELLSFHMREAGKVLIENLTKVKPETQTATVKPVTNENKFELFWFNFPSTDEHGVFRRTRMLKSSKEMCKKKYLALLAEGANHDDIIKALKYEVRLRKDGNNKTNSLSFMKNSLTWLNQKEYEVILEAMTDETPNSDNDWTSNSI